MCTIIGRKEEIQELNRIYHSSRAEFIAVYGRRRVGKTFLIDEVFKNNMTFHHTGLSPYDRQRKVSLRDQLKNFYFTLLRYGMEDAQLPKSWMEAFFLLQRFLERIDNGERQVVFIDELPWLDTPRSGFLTALEAFWNGWGNTRSNLCFVVCGSATSWMLDNLINNKGGLYGRLTWEMKLLPFTLKECEEYFLSRDIKMSRYNLVQSYMIFGGIPFYMNYFNPSLSFAQNIDKLFFDRNAKLGDEFDRLFNSIFDDADNCMKIIRFLGHRHSGFSREEISRKTGLVANGDLTKMLKALIASNFVTKYVPLGNSKRDALYKLTDNFCWFWLNFKEKKEFKETDYWEKHLHESEIASWRGIAFEEVCFNHIKQIKTALGIQGVSSEESSFIVKGDETTNGMQLDLVINRTDDVVNVCELKFYKEPFTIDKSYEASLRNRQITLEHMFPSKSILLTCLSTFGVVLNEYVDIFSSRITIDELFV